jgi:nucleoside phosphorylase
VNRAVVLTALSLEYRACRNHLAQLREETFEGTVYETGQFRADGAEWQVSLVEVGAGNARAAAETERAIRRFSPDALLFVGVAGGLKDVAL